MKQLPALLEPWRPWLSLFPAALAAPLGELLLRLHPQIGPLRSAPARADSMPEGVGSIVQRGPYERMLITEWAYADAEPDEFIRRAASGELMFTGPEPAARQRSRRCVALFDAGPAQLGEARLLHLALFILLARRAEEAGALFEWGILQQPATLHSDSGVAGIGRLLKGRTLASANADASQAWAACIDAQLDDLWIIGAHGLAAPCPARGQVAIRRSMLGEQLDVSLTMQRATRKLSLALPPPALGTRLLRKPFEPLAIAGDMIQKEGRPSLQQPPRFAAYGEWLAVPQLDGGVRIFHVPCSLKNKPGKSRHYPPSSSGRILAVGLFARSLGCVVAAGNTLTFTGFPSEALAGEAATCERPKMKQFHAPPGMGRWLQAFFLNHRQNGPQGVVEDANVIVLDLDRNLGCWANVSTKSAKRTSAIPPAFRLLGENVIGAAQFDQQLLFACARDGSTGIYAWQPEKGGRQVATVPRTGTRVFFGEKPGWAYRQGLLALQCNDTDWFVGDGQHWATISVESGATVLGVATSRRHGQSGLVVRGAAKTTIELRTGLARIILVNSSEKIAQASLNSANGNIAWIGEKTLRICVQGLDEERPFLQVLTAEAEHAQ